MGGTSETLTWPPRVSLWKPQHYSVHWISNCCFLCSLLPTSSLPDCSVIVIVGNYISVFFPLKGLFDAGCTWVTFFPQHRPIAYLPFTCKSSKSQHYKTKKPRKVSQGPCGGMCHKVPVSQFWCFQALCVVTTSKHIWATVWGHFEVSAYFITHERKQFHVAVGLSASCVIPGLESKQTIDWQNISLLNLCLL